jgi:hypothetical protein
MSELSKRSLEPIRFGEFLYERQLITEEELICALGEHWSNGGRIGTAISRLGLLQRDEVERAAAAYHTLEIVELEDNGRDGNRVLA